MSFSKFTNALIKKEKNTLTEVFAFCYQGGARNIKRANWERSIATIIHKIFEVNSSCHAK